MRVTDEMVDAAIREWALHTGVEVVPFQMRPTLEAALAAAPQAEPTMFDAQFDARCHVQGASNRQSVPDDHLAGLRAVERAARAAEREACANLLEASLREHMAEIHRLRAALEQPSPATLFDPRGSLGEPIV